MKVYLEIVKIQGIQWYPAQTGGLDVGSLDLDGEGIVVTDPLITQNQVRAVPLVSPQLPWVLHLLADL